MSRARAVRLAVALALALPLVQASALPGIGAPALPSAAAAQVGFHHPLDEAIGPFLEPPAEGASCLGSLVPVFCARAASDVSLSCTANATAFSCDVSASHEAAGSTATSAGGDLLVPSHLEVAVCNGPGPCDVTATAVAAPCSWAAGAHGCATTGTTTSTVSGAIAGCLWVWVSLDLTAHARAQGLALDLAQDQAGDLEEFSTC